MSKLAEFKKNAKAAISKGKLAEAETVQKLKRMSPEEFARAPRELLEDLSAEQYGDVLSHVVGVVKPVKASSHRSRPGVLKRLFDSIPALVLTFLTVLLAFGSVLCAPTLIDWWGARTPPVRTSDAATWPSCKRLNAWVDGCTYTVTSADGLPWFLAADMLGLPETYVRESNPHIVGDPIPTGSILVVWRERTLLARAP
jgi:hypothetical protein